jgi:hypothetical protein
MSHLAGEMGNAAVHKPKGESQTEEVARNDAAAES